MLGDGERRPRPAGQGFLPPRLLTAGRRGPCAELGRGVFFWGGLCPPHPLLFGRTGCWCWCREPSSGRCLPRARGRGVGLGRRRASRRMARGVPVCCAPERSLPGSLGLLRAPGPAPRGPLASLRSPNYSKRLPRAFDGGGASGLPASRLMGCSRPGGLSGVSRPKLLVPDRLCPILSVVARPSAPGVGVGVGGGRGARVGSPPTGLLRDAVAAATRLGGPAPMRCSQSG